MNPSLIVSWCWFLSWEKGKNMFLYILKEFFSSWLLFKVNIHNHFMITKNKKTTIIVLVKIFINSLFYSKFSFFIGRQVWMLGRQIERNSSYVWLANSSIFGLCFMSVCQMKSNCYSLIYFSLLEILQGHAICLQTKWKYFSLKCVFIQRSNIYKFTTNPEKFVLVLSLLI